MPKHERSNLTPPSSPPLLLAERALSKLSRAPRQTAKPRTPASRWRPRPARRGPAARARERKRARRSARARRTLAGRAMVARLTGAGRPRTDTLARAGATADIVAIIFEKVGLVTEGEGRQEAERAACTQVAAAKRHTQEPWRRSIVRTKPYKTSDTHVRASRSAACMPLAAGARRLPRRSLACTASVALHPHRCRAGVLSGYTPTHCYSREAHEAMTAQACDVAAPWAGALKRGH